MMTARQPSMKKMVAARPGAVGASFHTRRKSINADEAQQIMRR